MAGRLRRDGVCNFVVLCKWWPAVWASREDSWNQAGEKGFWFTDREICILLNDETDHIVPLLKLKLSSGFPLRSALISLPPTGFLAYVFKALTTL